MIRIRKHIEIDAGHRIPFHDSKCRHLHGHRYRIEVEVGAEETIDYATERSDAGMVLDFGVIKRVLMEEVHDPFDHRMMLWEMDIIFEDFLPSPSSAPFYGVVTVPIIPTAEELARYWGALIQSRLKNLAPGVHLLSLTVRETPTCSATVEFESVTTLDRGIPPQED